MRVLQKMQELGRQAFLDVFALAPRRETGNTLDLVDACDATELLDATAEEFDVKIPDSAVEHIYTVGPYFDLICRLLHDKTGTVPDPDQVWTRLSRLLREFVGRQGPIDRDTSFFADHP